MSKRVFNKNAPFQSLRGASYLTGLSIGYLREGCRRNEFPHVKVGKEYRVNMPELMTLLNEQAANSVQGGR